MKLAAQAALGVGLVYTGMFGVQAAAAQQTGVSHPEQIPVTTSSEGIAQPVVYEEQQTTLSSTTIVETPAQPATLKTRVQPAEPVAYVPSAPPSREPAASEATATVRAEEPPSKRNLRASVEPVAGPARSEEVQGLLTPGDPDANIVTRVPGPANEIPTGSMLHVRLREKLSTGATRPGALFTAELEQSVERDGRILLPAGSIVKGRVTEVHGGRRSSGSASLHLQPSSVILPDGTTYTLRAQVIDTSLYKQQKVDDEGTILRSDHVKGTVAAFGLATGSGAAAGGVLAGWPGAIIGAGVGAGISTVVWLRQDHQTELPVGTVVTLGTTSPLTVGLE